MSEDNEIILYDKMTEVLCVLQHHYYNTIQSFSHLLPFGFHILHTILISSK